MIDSRIALVLFTVLFITTVSFLSTSLEIEGVECSDPAQFLSEPGGNETSIEEVTNLAGGIIDIFFGCSSQNPLVNGFFLALQASIVVFLLMIVKDLVPFT